MTKDIRDNTWGNTSEVTTLIPGDGIAITEDSNGNPVISATEAKIINPISAINGIQVFTTSQPAYTLPTGITAAKITLIGGGGGGSDNNSSIGTGGGAGATTIVYLTDINGSIEISLGIGGGADNDGSNTTVTVNGQIYNANCGKKGIGVGSMNGFILGTGGAGGAAETITSNIISFAGESGQNGWGANGISYSGAGGNSTLGGAGGYSCGGNSLDTNNNAMANTGSGGAGISNSSGAGAGAAGICIIEY